MPHIHLANSRKQERTAWLMSPKKNDKKIDQIFCPKKKDCTVDEPPMSDACGGFGK